MDIYLYHRWGGEVRYDDSTKLREIFGNLDKLELDFFTPQVGDPGITCEGADGTIHVLQGDEEGKYQVVPITTNRTKPKKLELRKSKAYVSILI